MFELSRLIPYPVSPAVIFKSVEDAVPVADALRKGGINVIEVLVRGDSVDQEITLASIAAIRAAFPDMIISAGTQVTSEQMEASKAAGADFLISPVFTTELAEKAQALDMFFVPAGMTPTEIDAIYRFYKEHALPFAVKTFLMEHLATDLGFLVGYYTTLMARVPREKASKLFCPSWNKTSPDNLSVLANEKVITIAAAWLTPPEFIEAKFWEGITQLAECVMVASQQIQNSVGQDSVIKAAIDTVTQTISTLQEACRAKLEISRSQTVARP